jgi:nitrate reductase alpha subunit
MTDSMVRKAYFGHTIGTGFEADVHSPSGAPKEAYVKITKAEDGGAGALRLWRPVSLGLRPEKPSDALRAYLAGAYLLGA